MSTDDEPSTERTVFRHDDTFNVDLVVWPRHPILDPTLGIGLKDDAKEGGPERIYSRRLVTLGDSLTQGFQHFAIHNTALSWPAMIAGCLGLTAAEFRYPTFTKPGGYPVNLEDLLRLDDGYIVEDAAKIWEYLKEVRDFYAPAGGPQEPPPDSDPNDNLAVWGWDLRDLLVRTADTERSAIGRANPILRQIPWVDHGMNRTGVLTLTEYRDIASVNDGSTDRVRDMGRTALELAERRGTGEAGQGIETLVVWIGSNNALKAIGKHKVVASGDGYDDLSRKGDFTVWTPEHFRSELELLEKEVAKINAEHVLWGTVPHVTIPPLAHGVDGRLDSNPRYFKYYTWPWESDDSFHPRYDSALTGDEAWTIDSVIDAYNTEIVNMVTRQRNAGHDWRIVDTCAVLDRLAVRRNDEPGGKRYGYLPPYPLPAEYWVDGKYLDTRFIDVVVDKQGKSILRAGGLIGLDGVHPTTAGYGLVAHEFMKVMHSAGVEFPNVADPDDPEPDWAAIVRSDSILQNPPKHIDDVLRLLRTLESEWSGLQQVKWT